MAPQRRQALHHQRPGGRVAGPGPQRGGLDRRPRPLDVPGRARRHGQDPAHREQDGDPRLADVRDPVRQHPGRAARQAPLRAHALRHEPDERRPAGRGRAGPRHRRGRLPRGRPVLPRAHPVRQADPEPAGGRPAAALDAGGPGGHAGAAGRDGTLGGPVEGLREGRRGGRLGDGPGGSRPPQAGPGPGRDPDPDGEVLRHRDGQPGLLPGHAGPRRRGLHARVQHRAPLPRRPHHQHLRGHEPAPGGRGHRQAPQPVARSAARRMAGGRVPGRHGHRAGAPGRADRPLRPGGRRAQGICPSATAWTTTRSTSWRWRSGSSAAG